MISKIRKTFIDLCLEGDADLTEIDDYVEAWHNSDEDIEIHTFLGMTLEEYFLWVENPNAIRMILFAKRYDFDIDAIGDQTDCQFAARSDAPKEIIEVIEWLKEMGRI